MTPSAAPAAAPHQAPLRVTFLVLLIGIGPKIALVPFLEITASLDPAAKQRVVRKMMTTAATVAVVLMVLGELLRALLHFTVGSLSIG